MNKEDFDTRTWKLVREWAVSTQNKLRASLEYEGTVLDAVPRIRARIRQLQDLIDLEKLDERDRKEW